MKKILITSLLLCSIFMVGCGNKTNAKEEAMKEYATKFFQLHQQGDNGVTNPTISIAKLKNAIEVANDSYDLTKLEGCTDESYVELKLDDSRQITDVIYHMDCK